MPPTNLSGYRDPHQKLIVTNNHSGALDPETLADRGLTLTDMTIAIRKREVVSARPLDILLYNETFGRFVPDLPSRGTATRT